MKNPPTRSGLRRVRAWCLVGSDALAYENVLLHVTTITLVATTANPGAVPTVCVHK